VLKGRSVPGGPVSFAQVFTGIVEEKGQLLARRGDRFRFAAQRVLEGAGIGDSIAVNGCCLTVVEQGVEAQGATWWEADVSAETLTRTNLGDLEPGRPVNLERPMQLGDRLGGHLVLGHVDAVGEVVNPVPDLVIRIPKPLMRYLVEKGSVAVDGVSLTAFDLTEQTFSVAIIPHTAEATNLGTKAPGDRVNIEVDMVAKHIERLAEPHFR
jgi:riboflavin synthase